MTTTSTSFHVVCPHCDAVNRLPAERPPAAAKCGQCHAALFLGHPLALDARAFEHRLKREELPLLVDFWAPWCGPCKVLAPILAEAAQRLEPRARVVKINTDEEQALAGQFAIRGIPTLILFKRGREVARTTGALDLRALLRWVEPQL